MAVPEDVNDELDGCDIDFSQAPQMTDEEFEVAPLFARANDPNDPETIEDVERRWNGVPNGSS